MRARHKLNHVAANCSTPMTTRELDLHPWNRDRFCNNSKFDKLISKQFSVENKAKLSQLTRVDFATIAKLTN